MQQTAIRQLLALRKRTNDAFWPLYWDHHRFLVLMGGGGSGKSIFAGEKVLQRCATEPGHRCLVCRKVARTLRDSCFTQLCRQISDNGYSNYVAQINRGDMRISFTNGSEILFAGLDDVEKLKSIYGITMMWIEEASELLESDFNQLDIRMRGETAHYKQMIITFNPISILHWLKKRFFDRTDDRACVMRSTYKDNRFLPDEDRLTLEKFRDSDPYYYTVYCLGEWGVTGQTVFPGQIVSRRLAEIVDGTAEDEMLTIYEKPVASHPYVIGVDTAGDGSDYSVAQVVDNLTGHLVATMRRDRIDEDVFAERLIQLGYRYNTALIGIETNFSTHPIKVLEHANYPRQYVRETEDSYTHKPKKAFGWRTTHRNRNAIIAGLISIVREHADWISDRATLEEMLTFIRNEQFRPEAEAGAHDDCIMALAIAYAIRDQQSAEEIVEHAAPKVEWTSDMLEDYENATEDERSYLRRIWGEPNYG